MTTDADGLVLSLETASQALARDGLRRTSALTAEAAAEIRRLKGCQTVGGLGALIMAREIGRLTAELEGRKTARRPSYADNLKSPRFLASRK